MKRITDIYVDEPCRPYWVGTLHTGWSDLPTVQVGGAVGILARGACMDIDGSGLVLWGSAQPGGIRVLLGDEETDGVDYIDWTGVDLQAHAGLVDDDDDPTEVTEGEIREAVREALNELAAEAFTAVEGEIEETFDQWVQGKLTELAKRDEDWILVRITGTLVFARRAGGGGWGWEWSPGLDTLIAAGIDPEQAQETIYGADIEAGDYDEGLSYRIDGAGDYPADDDDED